MVSCRIQSDDLTLFGAFLEIVKHRIESLNEKSTLKSQNQESKIKLVFLPKIPINEILSKVDDHITALDNVKLLQVSRFFDFISFFVGTYLVMFRINLTPYRPKCVLSFGVCLLSWKTRDKRHWMAF